MEKEIFILGAGFSYAANLPLQKNLISDISKNKNFSLLKEQEMFEKFLVDFLDFDDDDKENRSKIKIEIDKVIDQIDIEDIFTIFDRAYKNEEYFHKYSWNELHQIRVSLIRLIIDLIDKRLSDFQSYKSVYGNFIQYICKNYENISIVLLNWDTLLEKLVKEVCNDIKIDYCFYTYSLYDEHHIPHINLKSKNEKNLKIIKPHGSINWLLCQNCQRMYVDDKEVKSIGKETEQICPNCKMYSKFSVELDNFIITPTIIKNFDNLHLKYIWNNALIEIQEAKKITFIGYSFPKADYEFLYLVKKAFSKNKQIIVVDVASAQKNVKKRYETIFSNVEFNFNGFEKWSKKLKN